MKETGIQAIIQKIRADAERDGSERYLQIKTETDEEIERENALLRDELQKRREMLTNHNKHEYAVLLDRLSSRFNHELLACRNSLINEMFDMAVGKLRTISKKEFSDLFTAAVAELTGKFTLYLGEYSAGKFDAGRVREAMERNNGLEITLSEERVAHKSGFLLCDDRVEYNCLFEDLIENKKTEQAALILKEVFG